MNGGPRLQVTAVQQLRLNAGLLAGVRMLRADAAGLTRYLEEQAVLNPHLRLVPAPPPAPGEWLPRWTGAFGAAGAASPGINAGINAGTSAGINAGASPSFDPTESLAAASPSLIAHVLTQTARLFATGPERRIALALTEALEPSGWLGRPLTVIAAETGATLAEVETVLSRLQRIEPAGLFARNLAECLRLQALDAGLLDPVMAVVLDHLDLLAAGDHARLARLGHCTADAVALRFRQIRGFDPKPGTAFAPLAARDAREPDLLARVAAAGGWEVSLNRSSLPTLRIDPSNGAGGPALSAARVVQRQLAARNATLLRVGREILQRQVLALENGPGALTAMTMAGVAEALSLHESTISRVVAGISVDTPRGTWWLRALFSQALHDGETGPAAAALRDRLARLIAAEPPAAPHSDACLAQMLSAEGVMIARRTVTKYRKMLNLPAAQRRKRGG